MEKGKNEENGKRMNEEEMKAGKNARKERTRN